jgi:hypothetical protein
MNQHLILHAALVVCLIAYVNAPGTPQEKILSKIDHLVYATPDLNKSVKEIEQLLGVGAVAGGQHPGAGTRNWLVGLGDEVYLEIIGPDPDQPKPQHPRHFGIDELTSPRLATWAAKSTDLERTVREAREHGVDLGVIAPGSRMRPDGTLLLWRLTASPALTAGGVLPFFIDWGRTQHPAASLPKGCKLIDLRAEHPEADAVQTMAAGLGLDLKVTKGPAPILIATISTPSTTVELK